MSSGSLSKASLSRLDAVYRSLLLAKFFTKGWGDVEHMKRIFSFRKIISDRDKCKDLVASDYPVTLGAEVESTGQYSVFDGQFDSPFVDYLQELVPHEARQAKFQMMVPKKWAHPTLRPICLHLAGTGDHYFWRRKVLMAKPLLKEAGIASVILENPFYGFRKPVGQKRSSLRNVSDIFIMGGCLILESLVLFHWFERMGYGPICVTGISMGGHMASLAGCSWHKPLSLVPCLSWTTASCAFTQGVMRESISWDILENEFTAIDEANRQELKEMIHSPEYNAMFNAGQKFAKSFPITVDSLNLLPMGLGFKTNGEKSGAKNNNIKSEAISFMREVMDECTHLGNFKAPVDPELAIIVSALRDRYVPQEGLIPLTKLWKGSEHRQIDCGHVAAILFNSDTFRKAIIDSLELNAQKYYGSSLKQKSETRAKA